MGTFFKDCEQKVTPPLGSLMPLEKKIREFKQDAPHKVVLIAGPTACGKTALSLLVAHMLDGEVISCDSMQVYRGMDVGTAKITAEEMGSIEHHLIDIRDIHESFNVVDFYYEARQAVESILARGKVPIIVGGSGFYFRSFIYGPPDGPPSIPTVRKALEIEMRELGAEALYERLREFDGEYAETITSGDKHKVIRALEIIILTGEKVSQLRWQHKHPLTDYALHPWFIFRPRPMLYPAIDARCELMLEKGLIDEVKALDRQGLRANLSAAQAIGYRQCLEYLDTAEEESDYKHFVTTFKQASRQYAKRQFTWFKKEKLFKWLDVNVHDLEIAAEMIVQEFQSTAS